MSSSEYTLHHEKLYAAHFFSLDTLKMGGQNGVNWIFGNVSKDKVSVEERENGVLLQETESVEKVEEKQDDSGLDINPDRCYSWLNVRSEDSVDGKKSNESVSSLSSSTSTAIPMPQAPDGGWGWFVVLGAFTVTLICDGLSYCFGVLYAELLDQFGESHSKTSLVGSVFYGVAMLLGPLASALTTRFGCRRMTIIGGIISSVGLFLSCFATSIEMLCVTFSFIVGIGFSFCYITSVVVVAFYFDKRRALATGLAVCGTGVGTFSFAPLMDFLIIEFGWRGMFIVMSGISLNLIVCGMLFRPLQFTESERWDMLLEEFNKIPHSREDIEFVRSRYPSDSSESHSDEVYLEEEARTLSVLSLPTFVKSDMLRVPSSVLMEALKNSKNPHHTLQRYMKNAMLQIDSSIKDICYKDVGDDIRNRKDVGTSVDIPTFSMSADTSDDEAFDSIASSILDNSLKYLGHPKQESASTGIAATPPGSPQSSNYLKSANEKHVVIKTETYAKIMNGKTYTVAGNNSQKEKLHHKHHEFSFLEGRPLAKRLSGVHIGKHNAFGIHLPLYRSDIFYRRLLKNLPPHKSCTLGTSCPELTETAAPETKDGFLGRKFVAFFKESSEFMKNLVEIRLLVNPFFLVFVTSNFIFYFWDDVPYMYAADQAVIKGIGQQKASFLLSIIGIFNTIGQVVFGFVGDMDINILNVYAIISAIGGLFVALVPLMTTFVSMSAMYGLFGFFISVSFPLTTVLLVNYLGMAKLTNSYGLLMLMQGIANLLGPPFAGWISDTTESYDAAYYLSGFFYAVSGLILFLVYVPSCLVLSRSQKNNLEMSYIV